MFSDKFMCWANQSSNNSDFLSWVSIIANSESLGKNENSEPESYQEGRDRCLLWSGTLLIPSPTRFCICHTRSLLQITLIGQGVRLATLDPSGHVTIWNDKREQLSLNVAIIPRLVKYGQKYQSQSLNNAVFRDEFVEVFDRFWLYRTDQSITRSREVKNPCYRFSSFFSWCNLFLDWCLFRLTFL